MALTDLTRISTSGIATGSTIDSPILRKDVSLRGSQVGVTSALFDSSENELNLKDNVKLTFGNAGTNDSQFYFDSNNLILQETSASGSMLLRGQNIRLQNSSQSNENYIECLGDNANRRVKIYQGATTRFETTSTGVVVTGILTASSFSGPIGNPSGISTFYDLRVTNNLTVEGTTTTLDTNLIDVDRVEIGANSNTNTAIVGIQSGIADIVNLFDGTTKVLTVKDGGKVGIGTDNVQSLLHLKGTGGSTSGLRLDNSHDNVNAYFHDDSNDSDFLITYSGTGGAELTLHADGNLGLNESNGDDVFIGANQGTGYAKFSVSKAGSGITTAIGLSNGNGTGSRIMSSRALVLSADHDNNSGGGQSYIGFETDSTEKVRITNVGRVLLGHDTQSNDFHGPQTTTNRNPYIQLHGENASSAAAALISWSSNSGSYYSPVLYLGRSGSATKGTNGIIPTGGTLGSIVFSGDDGTDFVKGAMITAESDGTPGNNDMPGRLEFHTTPAGAQVPEERLRITSSGQFHMGGTSGWTYASQKFVVVEPSNPLGMLLQGNNANQGVNLTLQNISPTFNAYSDISFADDGGQIFGAIRGKVVDRDNNYGEIQFHTSAGSLGQKVTINKDGKVGIGTDNPQKLLELQHITNRKLQFSYDDNIITIKGANNNGNPETIRLIGGNSIRFHTGAAGSGDERLRITSGGNLITYNNHTSGTSAHQNTGWYGDDTNHYTLEYKDFNEIRAIKTHDVNNYKSIVYKREAMTEYCDIEFTLKGNSPTGTYRHVGFYINGDGSDTTANMDRLVFRYRPASTTHNAIRLDKGGGGNGFNHSGSDIPNFFDGNERHIHIQIRKRTFSITVNRQGHSEYNLSTRMDADLVASRGYFGFTIYEQSSQGNPEITIRDFKITNYTQNAIPSTSVAFQSTIATGNPSKNSGYVTKPADEELFDNGYGGNYNTSNYRFTAPVAGIYQFSNTFNCYSSPNDMFCSIRVNGSTQYIGNKRNNNTGNGDQNVTAYAIVQLEEGDYVDARDNTSNSVTYSSGVTWNRFEGSLIAAYK